VALAQLDVFEGSRGGGQEVRQLQFCVEVDEVLARGMLEDRIWVAGRPGAARFVSVQNHFSLMHRDPERDATIVFVNSSEDMRAAYSSKRVDALVTANPASDERVKEGSFLLFNGSKRSLCPSPTHPTPCAR
ncbi:hypothetical protein B4Q13_15975, partial [Lacticaseibacillus rhamnosus]